MLGINVLYARLCTGMVSGASGVSGMGTRVSTAASPELVASPQVLIFYLFGVAWSVEMVIFVRDSRSSAEDGSAVAP